MTILMNQGEQMKKSLISAASGLLLLTSVSFAGAADASLCNGVTKEFLSSKLPFQVDEILDKQSLSDVKLCQVIIRVQSEKGSAYVTANKEAVILGNLYRNKQPQAAKTMDNLSAKAFKKYEKNLPSIVAFTYKPAGAKKFVYMFTDPDCPACNQTKADAQQWAFEKKVELRVVFFPLPMHGAPAKDKAVKGICGNMTYDNYVQGEYPGSACKDGESKVAASIDMAAKLGIEATPSFLGPTGKQSKGYSRQGLDKIIQ